MNVIFSYKGKSNVWVVVVSSSSFWTVLFISHLDVDRDIVTSILFPESCILCLEYKFQWSRNIGKHVTVEGESNVFTGQNGTIYFLSSIKFSRIVISFLTNLHYYYRKAKRYTSRSKIWPDFLSTLSTARSIFKQEIVAKNSTLKTQWVFIFVL